MAQQFEMEAKYLRSQLAQVQSKIKKIYEGSSSIKGKGTLGKV